ncbi:hypothetical protein [Streptomyces fumanus]
MLANPANLSSRGTSPYSQQMLDFSTIVAASVHTTAEGGNVIVW